MSLFATAARQMCTSVVTRSWSRQQKIISVLRPRLTGPSAVGVRPLHLSSATLGSAGEGYHRPSDMDKRILVWTKKYAHVSEVPDEVTNAQMKKAKDIFRIRVNLMMIAATVFLSILYALSGRRAAQQGDSVVRRNRLWHASEQK